MTLEREKYLDNISSKERYIREQIACYERRIRNCKIELKRISRDRHLKEAGLYEHCAKRIKGIIREWKCELWCYKQALTALKDQEYKKACFLAYTKNIWRK